jgi:hypothetical protein
MKTGWWSLEENFLPGPLLHVNATVTCSHGGKATPLLPYPRVTVSGQPIVTKMSPYVIAGCTLPPAAGGPCATAQFVSFATRIQCSLGPVLLMDSQATCVPTGTPLLTTVVQQRAIGT